MRRCQTARFRGLVVADNQQLPLPSVGKILRDIRYPAARTSDPSSSHDAAERVTDSGKRNANVVTVVDCVSKYPSNTSGEIARLCGLERHEAARRTADAEHAGAVKKGEQRVCALSGRKAVTWWPT